MSLVVSNRSKVSLTQAGEMYGIKPVYQGWDFGLRLPFKLKDTKESNLLVDEIKHLFLDAKTTSFYNDLEITVPIEPKKFFSTPPYGRIYIRPKEDAIEIGMYEFVTSDLISTLRRTVMIDKILRRTLLGRRLKEYWMSKDGIDESQAEARLVEVTPYADSDPSLVV